MRYNKFKQVYIKGNIYATRTAHPATTASCPTSANRSISAGRSHYTANPAATDRPNTSSRTRSSRGRTACCIRSRAATYSTSCRQPHRGPINSSCTRCCSLNRTTTSAIPCGSRTNDLYAYVEPRHAAIPTSCNRCAANPCRRLCSKRW